MDWWTAGQERASYHQHKMVMIVFHDFSGFTVEPDRMANSILKFHLLYKEY